MKKIINQLTVRIIPPLLSSDLWSDLNYKEKSKRQMLVYVLSFVAILFSIFIFLDLKTGDYIEVGWQSIITIWLLLCIHYVKKSKKNIFWIYRIITIIIKILVLFFFWRGGPEGTKAFWFLSFPLYCFFILGKKEGSFFVLLSLFISFFLVYDPQGILGTYPYSKDFLIRFYLMYIAISFGTFLYESTHEKNMELLTGEKNKLDEAKKNAQTLAKKAEMANIAKRNFLAIMSHEIRTPLNGVIGMSEILMNLDLTQEQQGYADIISISANSLLLIIDDILDLSKIEAGKLDIEIIKFNLHKMLLKTCNLFRLEADKKNLKFDCIIEHDVPAMIMGDPKKLGQIMMNLVSNSIKFTSEGKVTLKVALEKNNIEHLILCFTVTDTGIGIKPEKIKMLFNAFTQAEDSTTREYGGTGLGLTISKRLAEMIGGAISVQSKFGEGATFKFTGRFKKISSTDDDTTGLLSDIPGRRNPPIISVQDTKTSEISRIDRNKKIRILLAEDNIINQKVARKMLEKLGYNADIAIDGIEVIKILKSIPYDIVFMDCQMPEMDGYEATRIIRNFKNTNSNHRVPIIAMTANAMQGDREKCLAAGMNDYISKPIMPDALLNLLEKWI